MPWGQHPNRSRYDQAAEKGLMFPALFTAMLAGGNRAGREQREIFRRAVPVAKDIAMSALARRQIDRRARIGKGVRPVDLGRVVDKVVQDAAAVRDKNVAQVS